MPEEMTFEDYSESFQTIMVKELVNTLPSKPISDVLKGLSRQFLDFCKEQLFLEHPKFIDSHMIIAKSNTKLGKFLIVWKSAVLLGVTIFY